MSHPQLQVVVTWHAWLLWSKSAVRCNWLTYEDSNSTLPAWCWPDIAEVGRLQYVLLLQNAVCAVATVSLHRTRLDCSVTQVSLWISEASSQRIVTWHSWSPQVAALLNQLQELLRRAELERDKAKMQLKRQRVRASCCCRAQVYGHAP